MLRQDLRFFKKHPTDRGEWFRTIGVIGWLALAALPSQAVAADIKVMVLEPQAADKSTKLWPELRGLVAKTVADYIGRSGGYLVVRPSPGQGTCDSLDFGCVARVSASKSELVLGSKVQVNADNTIYLTFTMLDTQNPEHVESQHVPFGAPGRKRDLSREEEDQLATRIEGTIGTLFRTLSQGATPAPTAPVKPVSLPDDGKKLTVELDGNGSVQSEPQGFHCDQPECAFPGTPPTSITLVASPSRARTVTWSGVSCLNSVLADPLRCQLEVAKDTHIKVLFARSMKRKIGAGLFLGLSVASLASGFAFLGLQGQPVDESNHYSTWKLGALGLSLGAAFGATSGLIYFY